MDGCSGRITDGERWMQWMDAVDGCGGWMRWMDAVEGLQMVIDGCGEWMRWMDAVDGCGGWMQWKDYRW